MDIRTFLSAWKKNFRPHRATSEDGQQSVHPAGHKVSVGAGHGSKRGRGCKGAIGVAQASAGARGAMLTTNGRGERGTSAEAAMDKRGKKALFNAVNEGP